MSVPKGHQGDGKLLVNELARDLVVYTIRITSNPKVFLPQYQTALTNEIVRCATNIHKYAWTANNVMVRGPDGREKSRWSMWTDTISAGATTPPRATPISYCAAWTVTIMI